MFVARRLLVDNLPLFRGSERSDLTTSNVGKWHPAVGSFRTLKRRSVFDLEGALIELQQPLIRGFATVIYTIR